MYTPEVLKALGSYGDSSSDTSVERVIIVGIESHVCVMQTAFDFLRAGGQKPIILADGVSSCNAQEVPVALARLAAAGCDVATSESVLFQLMGDAAEPNFKAFSGLIKTEKEGTVSSLKALLGKGL